MAYESYVSIAGIPKHRLLDFDERIDPATTALVVIDVQNDFCDPNGRAGQDGEDLSRMPAMIENTRRLVEEARRHQIMTVFVRASYDEVVRGPALTEQQKRRRGFTGGLCLEGTWGIEFVPGTGPVGLPHELVVTKHRFSVFWGTEIDLVLRSNGIKTVVLCGVITEGCVESSARDAFFRDYYVVIAQDSCAGFTVAGHEAALANLNRSYAKISDGAELAAAWAKSNAPHRGWQAEAKREKALGTLAARVAPEHTALVLIDVQNDFCSPEGRFGKRGQSLNMIQQAVPRIIRLLEWARAAGVKVFHVKGEYGPQTRHVGSPLTHRSGVRAAGWAGVPADAAPSPPPDALSESCIKGTWGGEFVDGIVPRDDEMIVPKHRFSGFVDTRLEQLLRSNGIRTVVLAGVTTNCCVESTARDAVMRDFYVVVAEDCVATPDGIAHLHRSTLDTLSIHFALVKPSEQVAGVWGITHDIRTPEMA